MCKKNWRQSPQWTAVTAALIAGFLTHLFAMVTSQFNYDNMTYNFTGIGDGITSGRWLLSLMYDAASALGFIFNLPALNALVFLALIAVAAGLLVSIFQIRSKVSAACVGMLMAVFPTATDTLIFRYAAPAYGLSVLLAVATAWILSRHKWGAVLAVVFGACSMGIYQANIPFTISIFVLLLLQQTLKGGSKPWPVIRRGLFYCGIILGALILYLVCLRLCLNYYHAELSDYLGINKMGQISLRELPQLLKETYWYVLRIPFADYCGVAPIPLVRIVLSLLGLASGVMLGIILLRDFKWPTLLLSLGLCAVYPLALNFVMVMMQSVPYTLMVYVFVLLPITPLILYELLPTPKEAAWRLKFRTMLAKGLGILMALLIFCYAYCDNINTAGLHYATVQMEHYVSSMITQVRMTEGFDTTKTWAFVGNVSDPMRSFQWGQTAKYGGWNFPSDNINDHSRYRWFHEYLGIDFETLDQEEAAKLAELDEVKQMPTWPNQGSVKVIGDLVVIKCEELTETEAK